MGQYGACDCLCEQNCVPGFCRPSYDLYDPSHWNKLAQGCWYTVPQIDTAEIPYHVASRTTEAVLDKTVTYAHVPYVHNAGSGNTFRTLKMRLYNSLVYTPSSLIERERLKVYIYDLRGIADSLEFQVAAYVYLYEQGIANTYIRTSFKTAIVTHPTLTWSNIQSNSRVGGYRIEDFSRLALHIRMSFNNDDSGGSFSGGAIAPTVRPITQRYEPETTGLYNGSWKARSPTARIPLYKGLDLSTANFTYCEVPTAGNRLVVHLPHVHPETTRRHSTKGYTWRHDFFGTVPSSSTVEVDLYCGSTLIRSDTSTSSTNSAHVLLTAAEIHQLTNYSDLRLVMRAVSIAGSDGTTGLRFYYCMFHSLKTPHVALSQAFLRRTCL